MPSAGALAMTARTSALVISVAVRGGIADCDEVTVSAARSTAAMIAGNRFLMNSPLGRLLYAHAPGPLCALVDRRLRTATITRWGRMGSRRRSVPSAPAADRHRRQQPDVREERRDRAQ